MASLWLLFDLPSAVETDRFALRSLRLSADVPLLFALAGAVSGTRVRWLRVAVGVVGLLLALYRVDIAISDVLTHQPPVLYDQMFLLKHLIVLARDLWDRRVALLLTAAAVGALLVSWLALRLLTAAARAFEGPTRRAAFVVCALASLIATFAGRPSAANGPWLAPQLARNVIDSVRLYRAVERGVRTSPYRAYRRVHLSRKPRLMLFFVESYGRVMAEAGLGPTWHTALGRLAGVVGRAGWHSASAFSRAPVSGGRSWLAHASVLAGVEVSHQALFQRLFIDAPAPVPSLPSFLRAQGYTTVLLAPSDRERAGVPLVNYYGYDRNLRATDLGYRGPALGWGKIPDGYSLAYAARYLSGLTGPWFLVFNMVSSHFPFTGVPKAAPVQVASTGIGPAHAAQASVPRHARHSFLVNQITRYAHEVPRSGIGPAPRLRSAYGRAISYDLELIGDFLAHLPGDALAVVMGDHQPPLLVSEHDDLAVPVHVFARDPALLQEFVAHGFTSGLELPADAQPAVSHCGLFSLWVRALARVSAQPLPEMKPEGLALNPPSTRAQASP